MKSSKRIYLLFGILALIYIGLILFLPPDASSLTRYSISPERSKQLALTIAVPYVLIWFIAFYGYWNIRHYADTIRKSADGRALKTISDGLLILAIGLPVAAILGNLLTFVGRTYPNYLALSTVTGVYIDMMIGVLGMTKIHNGAQELVEIADEGAKTKPAYIVMIFIAIIGTVYTYLTMTNPARQFPNPNTGRAAYYLPDWLLILTVILPYLYIWYSGLKAAYYIAYYRRNVNGLLYRSALANVARGIVAIIISRIFLRFLTSMNTLVSTWSLKYLLVVIYILILIIGIGYGLVARGAKKLKKIEEV